MRLKLDAIEVPKESPFQNDRLNRKSSTDAICQILSIMDEPLVLGICSPWGTGKTTFLRMLRIELESKKFRTIALNAWDNDFTESATVSILGEIERGIKKFHSESHPKSKASSTMDKFLKAGIQLVKTAVPFAVRIASGGLIGLPSGLQATISDFLAKVAEDQLDAYEKANTTIEDFKKKLADVLKSEELLQDQKPLVVLVDELDRCKPTYAIQFLEVTKHFFNIPRVAFILSIDESQLFASIRALYGQDIEANEYLRKFIDLRYYLPPAKSKDYLKSLYERYDFGQYFKQRATEIPSFAGDLEEFQQSSNWLFSIFEVSLRAQEQCLTRLSLILRSTPKNNILFPSVVMLFMMLREYDKLYYERILARRLTARQIVDYLMERDKGAIYKADHVNLNYLEAYLAVVLVEGRDPEQDYSETVNNEKAETNERTRAKDVLRMIEQINMNYHVGKGLEYFSKKVELMDPFTTWDL